MKSLLDLAALLRRTADMHRQHAALMAEYLNDADTIVEGLRRLAGELDRAAEAIERGEYGAAEKQLREALQEFADGNRTDSRGRDFARARLAEIRE